jgi:hypothetical protein
MQAEGCCQRHEQLQHDGSVIKGCSRWRRVLPLTCFVVPGQSCDGAGLQPGCTADLGMGQPPVSRLGAMPGATQHSTAQRSTAVTHTGNQINCGMQAIMRGCTCGNT